MPEQDLPEGGGSVLARVLRARGLGPDGGTGLEEEVEHEPRLLTDMEAAVALVGEAIRAGTRIAVHGDYDVDGVTATALLVWALRSIGVEPLVHIPRRDGDGYGLSLPALESLGAEGAGLVIAVDCGTTAVEAASGRPPGMRLVVTDHHLPQPEGPVGAVSLAPADALVNPQRPGDPYPFKGLAGVGVAYKLVEALEEAGLVPSGTASRQLPLVAMGTVADMMPLQGENRSLVRRGLSAWAEMAPLGLLALARGAGIEGVPDGADLAFSLGPRLNAAGRMEDAELALRCCLELTPSGATRAAAELESLNRSRRRSLVQAMEVALPMTEALPQDASAIVIGSPEFSQGVVGLVAGRLADDYQRPAFVFARSGDEWRGSARGTDGLDVVEVLGRCGGGLLRYGGHRGAGGFSVRPGSEGDFARAVAAAVSAQVGDRPAVRTIRVDALAQLGDCTLGLADQFVELGPFGAANPAITLCARGCRVLRSEPFGADRAHLRVWLNDRSGSAETVAFSRPWLRPHLPPGRLVDVLFELGSDRWRGRQQARLLLRDLRPAQPAALPAGAD